MRSDGLPIELSLNILASLDDLAAIICRLSVLLSQEDGVEVVSCAARQDLYNPFNLADRWEQLNEDEGGNIPALPADFALYEVEFELVLPKGADDASAYLNPITDLAFSLAVTPDRDEKIGNPRSICWVSTLQHSK